VRDAVTDTGRGPVAEAVRGEMRQGGQRRAAVRSGDGGGDGGAEVAGGTSATRGIISNTRLRRGRAVVQRVAHQPPPAARLRRRSHVQPQRVRPKRRRVSMSQWRRSVVKYGGGVRVSQIKPSNCFKDYTPRQRLPNAQQSRFLAARIGASKN